MPDDNKSNIQYFEAPSMRALYETMQVWQTEQRKRLLSLSVLENAGKYCCIALTNPSEVIIVDGSLHNGADVSSSHALRVYTSSY